MNRRMVSALLAVTLVFAVAVAGCGKNPSQSGTAGTTPVPGGTVTVAQGADALTMDPALTTDEASGPIQALIYDSLLTYDDKLALTGQLATSWDVPDARTFVFHLRQNVKFHNGDVMKASDVKFSFNRMLDKKLASPWASFFEDITSIETPDDNTVKVTLAKPNAGFLAAVAAYITVYDEAWVNAHPEGLQRIENGTGPYALGVWTPNTSVTLNKFKDYWGAPGPYLDSVVFKVIPDAASRLAALRTGEVQFLSVFEPEFAAQLSQMETAGQIKTAKVLDLNYHMLGFNTKRKPFDNPLVREALQYAVDRKAILDSAALGQGAVCGILSPAMATWATPNDQFPPYTRDVNKAKQLLTEAGYPNGFTFHIMAPSNFPTDVNSALIIQEQLKEVGVTAVIDKTEWGDYVNNWVKKDFDTFVGYNGDWTDPDLAMYAALHTGGSTNAFSYSDKNIDQLLEQGRNTADPAARKTIYDQIQKQLVKDGPMIYTFAIYHYYAVSPKLAGFAANPWSTTRNLELVWLTK